MMTHKTYDVSAIIAIDLRNKNFLEALAEIKARPRLWLTANNLICLESFISGWVIGRCDSFAQELLHDFDRYVAHYFEYHQTTMNSFSVIRAQCEPEEDSLTMFYELFECYLQTINKQLPAHTTGNSHS